MPVDQPRYEMEEYATRGDAIYDRDLQPHIEPCNAGKYVAIDIETGAYEVDASEIAASDRLLSRVPDAQTWLRRIGSRYARRIGARAPSERRFRRGGRRSRWAGRGLGRSHADGFQIERDRS